MKESGAGMSCFGIRGAVDVPCNGAEEILDATRRLLERILEENGIGSSDIVSVIFSATEDLDAVPPAEAARSLGWRYTPLLCMQEMRTRGAMARCIRVLMHVNGQREAEEIRHVYLGAAKALRPDLTEEVAT
jgi:chorismate mutase